MRIEILFVPGCPNVEGVRRRVAEALAETGGDASVSEVEVATPEDAARVSMAGSPAVLLNGRDLFAEGAMEGSLACRLHVPSVAQLVEAFSAAERESGLCGS